MVAATVVEPVCLLERQIAKSARDSFIESRVWLNSLNWLSVIPTLIKPFITEIVAGTAPILRIEFSTNLAVFKLSG